MTQFTVAGRQTLDTLPRPAAFQHLEIVIVSVGGTDRRQPVKTRPAFQKTELLTKYFLERLVDIDVASLIVLHERNGGTVVHETVEEGLALAQRFFRMFSFGQVTRDALHADGPTFAEDEPGADFESNAASLFRDNIDLVNRRDFLRRLVRDHLASEIQILRRDNVRDVHVHRLFASVAGDSFAAAVQRCEVAL